MLVIYFGPYINLVRGLRLVKHIYGLEADSNWEFPKIGDTNIVR